MSCQDVRHLDRWDLFEKRMGELTHAELKVFLILHRCAGNNRTAWPSVPNIAKRAFCCVRTAQAAIKKLVAMDLLRVAREATATRPTEYFVAPGARPNSLKDCTTPPQQLLHHPPAIAVADEESTQESKEESTPQTPLPPEAPPARVACAPVQSLASQEAILAKLQAVGPVQNPFAAKVAIKTFLRAGGEPDDFQVLLNASARRTREGFPRPRSWRVGLLITWMNEEHRWRPQVCETRRAWETRAYRKRQAEEASRWWLAKDSVPKRAQELVVELMRGVR